LRDAGAVILGKVKTTEGAFMLHHPSIPAPINPWKADRWAGISSSGSGVSVAAGLAFAALGSDTGGSIRLPSTCNGLTGLKPTYGRVSRYGVFVLADTLDHVGPMARSAKDAAAMLRIIAGADPHDPTAVREPVPDYLKGAPSRLDGVRVGVDPGFQTNPVIDAPVKKMMADTVEVFVKLGAKIVPQPLPDSSQVTGAALVRIMAEALKAHAATFPSRASEYGPAFREFLTGAEQLKPEMLVQAQLASEDYRKRFLSLYESVDLVLMPAIPLVAPDTEVFSRRSVAAGANDPSMVLGNYTIILDVAGVPSLTLPGGFDPDGVPMGFQIVGKLLDEEHVLEAGNAYQSVTDWHMRHPKI
jgi:amidase